MSTIYDKTDNYGLNLYGDDDAADLRDGYNGSMRTIDSTLETHLSRIEGVESRETHDGEVVKALLGDNTVDNATDAKIKWDKAGADATTAIDKADANKNILTEFGIDTPENANSFRNEIMKKTLVGKTYNIFIGDSWTQDNAGPWNTGDVWCEIISRQMNLEWINYAKGGTGFVREINNTNFVTQAQNAAAQTTRNHDECAYIFIMGGNNDVGTLADYDTYVKNIPIVYATLHNAYPNAQFVLSGLNCPMGHYFGANLTKYALPIYRFARTHPNIIFVDNPADFAFTQKSGTLEQYHPTQLGAQLIAKKFFSTMYGLRSHDSSSVVSKVWGFVKNYDDSETIKDMDIHSVCVKNANNVSVNMFIAAFISDPENEYDIAFTSENVYWDTETSTPPSAQLFVKKGQELKICFIQGTAFYNNVCVPVIFSFVRFIDNKACFKMITQGFTPNAKKNAADATNTTFRFNNVQINYTTPYPYGAFNGTGGFYVESE